MERKKRLIAWIMTFIVAFTTVPSINIFAAELSGGRFQDNAYKGDKTTHELSKLNKDTIIYPGEVITEINIGTPLYKKIDYKFQ